MQKRTRQLIKTIKKAFKGRVSIENPIKYYLNPLREQTNAEFIDKINELCNAVRELQNNQDPSLKEGKEIKNNGYESKKVRPYTE